MDEIVVITNGIISEHGTYQELLSRSGPFAEFINSFLTEASNELEDEGSHGLIIFFTAVIIAADCCLTVTFFLELLQFKTSTPNGSSAENKPRTWWRLSAAYCQINDYACHKQDQPQTLTLIIK